MKAPSIPKYARPLGQVFPRKAKTLITSTHKPTTPYASQPWTSIYCGAPGTVNAARIASVPVTYAFALAVV